MSVLGDPDPHLTFGKKLRNNSWGLVLLLCATAGLGFAILYSVAGGSIDPWVTRQAARFAIGFTLMMGVAFVDIRFWLKAAYPFYALSLVMRNRATSAQAWPHIELTLNNDDEKAVVRRVFRPRDYLADPAQVDRGIAPESEQQIKLNFELKDALVSGYRIYLFYP